MVCWYGGFGLGWLLLIFWYFGILVWWFWVWLAFLGILVFRYVGMCQASYQDTKIQRNANQTQNHHTKISKYNKKPTKPKTTIPTYRSVFWYLVFWHVGIGCGWVFLVFWYCELNCFSWYLGVLVFWYGGLIGFSCFFNFGILVWRYDVFSSFFLICCILVWGLIAFSWYFCILVF